MLTVKSLHPEEDINFIRIRSKKHEIMIAPEKEFSLIVLQNPSNDENNWMPFWILNFLLVELPFLFGSSRLIILFLKYLHLYILQRIPYLLLFINFSV